MAYIKHLYDEEIMIVAGTDPFGGLHIFSYADADFANTPELETSLSDAITDTVAIGDAIVYKVDADKLAAAKVEVAAQIDTAHDELTDLQALPDL